MRAHRKTERQGPGAMAGDREEYPAAGLDDHITKPIRVDALVGALSGAASARSPAP
jgi:CheY-like chemotaxis protein